MSCCPEHGAEVAAEVAVEGGAAAKSALPMACHTMTGLPDGLFYGALAGAAALSVVALVARAWLAGGTRSGWRFELTALRPVRALVGKRWFQFALQVPLVGALGLILYAGFFGTPVPERNAATLITWTLWWTLLILDILLLGRMWCLVCPWDAIASWIRRLAFWRRTDEPLSLDLPWPRWLRNVYPATVLFIGLTWLELGWGVTMSPRSTAGLGLLMVVLAVLPALIFERKSFCRYVCLVGRICGLYSMLAPVELRAKDRKVCGSCEGRDCLEGNENGYPCPTGQFLGTMDSNAYCTVCTECVKTCPHDNVAVNLRPWAADLSRLRRPRRDEAILALVMLSMTSFHGLTMTPIWTELTAWLQGVADVTYLPAFSVGMAAILVVPGALYLQANAVATGLGSRPGGGRMDGFWRTASTYAYPLVAVALMYHLAHNAGHFLVEAGAVIPMISDPFGRGWDLFGTSGFHVHAFASMPVIWGIQVVLVLIGHFWAVRATERAHRSLAAARKRPVPLRARLVTTGFLLACTAANLWLLAQPMEMRTKM